ncbi:hypothetical protein CA983_24660 [Streptomyces swartbergensis]|uniref:Uncharacterized protein n=1 Tax=Streptomyces swartbergensis TaxID=487165 RepID=A0A243S192_9ACTN|nr:hypothetical protein CA983_24660 [Streptomyces swartbergensis]
MRCIGTTVSSAVAGLILAHMTIDFHGAHIPTENGLRAMPAPGSAPVSSPSSSRASSRSGTLLPADIRPPDFLGL